MVKVPFYKYHGTGNDFIVIDDRTLSLPMDRLDVPALTDRHFGIGSDGLIIIRTHPVHDFEMMFYNPDGSMSFCGNGSRCAMQFAMDIGLAGETAEFLSTDGVHKAYKLEDGRIRLQMADCQAPTPIGPDFEINTGSPHFIRFAKLENLDIIKEARAVRYGRNYNEAGINVNFVEILNHGISMRTYERGVEDETLSCGTGVTAAALVTHFENGGVQGHHTMPVRTRGGELSVEFTFDGKLYSGIHLCGPVKKVYNGEIEI